jgi:hypothetical protein
MRCGSGGLIVTKAAFGQLGLFDPDYGPCPLRNRRRADPLHNKAPTNLHSITFRCAKMGVKCLTLLRRGGELALPSGVPTSVCSQLIRRKVDSFRSMIFQRFSNSVPLGYD